MPNPLSTKMREVADRDNLPDDHPMRIHAKHWEEATLKLNQGIEVKKFVGIWARARRIYCEYTGESLV